MTLLLSRADVAALAGPGDYLDAVRAGFRAAHTGRVDSPMPLHLGALDGTFHAKGALCRDTARGGFAAVKLNANFPANPFRFGLPTIAGAILLFDAENGALLAVLDSIEITLRRTAAASVLAAQTLAETHAGRLLICGCGAQGRAHAEAFLDAMPDLQVTVFDIDAEKATSLARGLLKRADIAVAPELQAAARVSDIIVTVTTAMTPILAWGDVRPGAFIAAAGADNPSKNEIAPGLMAAARIVADDGDQCAGMGELRAALAAGAVSRSDAVDLDDVLDGDAPGRRHAEQIVIYDSTGVAFQDAASAVMIHDRARREGRGLRFAFDV